MPRLQYLQSALILAAIGGCASPTIELGDGFGWNGTQGMHLPWAVGSDAVLTASLHRKLARRGEMIEATSSDEEVFLITGIEFDESTLWIDGIAVGPGTSQVVVSNDRRELGATRVEVSWITAAGMVPAVAALDPNEQETTTLYEQPRVVAKGEAHFRVQFYDEGTPVFGASIVDVDAAKSLDLHVDSSYLGVEGQWISVRPEKKGTFPVEILTDGQPVGNLELDVVGAAVIDRLELVGEEPRSPTEDQPLRLILRSWDKDGEPVFGAPVTWTIDGDEPKESSAEVFSYTYDESSVNLVEAELGDLRTSATIHGYPESKCSCGTSSPAGGWLFALALSLARVRRTATESARKPRR